MHSTPWANRNFGPLHVGKLVARGRETLRHLARLGVTIPIPNRLVGAIELVDQFNADRLQVDEHDLELQARLLEALRDLWEALLITYTVLKWPNYRSVFPADELRYLLIGGPADSSDPKPRSSQFEMVVASRLIIGGIDVSRAEPDLHFSYVGENVGLAAKRITRSRVRTVETAVRDATHQLRDNNIPGFIALSLDPWVDDLTLEDGAAAYGHKFNLQLSDVYRLIARMPDSPYVLGVLLFAHDSAFRFKDGVPSLEWSEGLQIGRFSNDPAEIGKSSSFFDPFQHQMWDGFGDAFKLIMPSSHGGR